MKYDCDKIIEKSIPLTESILGSFIKTDIEKDPKGENRIRIAEPQILLY